LALNRRFKIIRTPLPSLSICHHSCRFYLCYCTVHFFRTSLNILSGHGRRCRFSIGFLISGNKIFVPSFSFFISVVGYYALVVRKPLRQRRFGRWARYPFIVRKSAGKTYHDTHPRFHSADDNVSTASQWQYSGLLIVTT